MVGLNIGKISLTKNIQYPRGRSVNGKVRDILRSITEKDCSTNIQIRNGVILIRNIKQGLESSCILSAETGLIGHPKPITDTSDTPPDKRADYTAQCLLNYKIGAMSKITIDSKHLKGRAVVLKGSHQGSKTGDFITEMEIKML